MLAVTDAALRHLHNALSRTTSADSSCFRLTLQAGDSLGLVMQEPDPDDNVYECDGDQVLATPDPLSEFLSGRVLDLDGDGQLVLLPKAI